MTRAALDRFLFRFDKDAALQAAFAADPQAALEGLGLDADERAAVAAKDLATLYQWGVHPLLVRNFGATVGVKYVDAYAERGLTS